MNPPTPSPHQLCTELEAMVLGDLLDPAGDEDGDTVPPSGSVEPDQCQGD